MSLSPGSSSSVKSLVGLAGTVTDMSVSTNTAHLIHSISIFNTTAAVAYLQVFDLVASGVTVGTTTPTFVLGSAANGSTQHVFNPPIRLVSGCSMASCTTATGATGAAQTVTVTYAAAVS